MIRLFQAIVKGSSKRRILTVCLVFFLLASAVVKVMADSPPPPSQPGPIGNFTVTLVLGPLPSFFADKTRRLYGYRTFMRILNGLLIHALMASTST